MCIHAIENSRSGYGSDTFDPSIHELALAINKATDELPSMKELVPPDWLQVIDRMQKGGRQHLSFAEVQEVAAQCGLPHAGFGMEEELRELLKFFHSLGALLWFDTAELRSLVIVDTQWVVDAIGRLIRDHNGVHDELKPFFAKSARKCHLERDWEEYVERGRASEALLEKVVWSEERFAPFWRQVGGRRVTAA